MDARKRGQRQRQKKKDVDQIRTSSISSSISHAKGDMTWHAGRLEHPPLSAGSLSYL